jgi:TPP-dependent pyruvate/acetoin dehydrogenase alpha subunit
MHIASYDLGILGANGIVGGGIPIATGAGLSIKIDGSDKVVVCFMGDGATNQGTFHESVNIAAANDLPVIYVCENNLYGVGTYQPSVRAIEDIADRAQAYGIPGKIVDGNDVEEVFKATETAIKRARKGKGPTLIEGKTYRWYGHFEGDKDERPKEEIKKWKAKDPITRYRKKLLSDGVLSQEKDKEIVQLVEKEVADAVQFAHDSKLPDTSEAMSDIYSN